MHKFTKLKYLSFVTNLTPDVGIKFSGANKRRVGTNCVYAYYLPLGSVAPNAFAFIYSYINFTLPFHTSSYIGIPKY